MSTVCTVEIRLLGGWSKQESKRGPGNSLSNYSIEDSANYSIEDKRWEIQ